MNRRIALLLLLALCALAAPLAAQDATPEATTETTAAALPFQILVPQVLNQIPHSTTSSSPWPAS